MAAGQRAPITMSLASADLALWQAAVVVSNASRVSAQAQKLPPGN
jgi:hypothetical protein